MTLFPEMIEQTVSVSITGRALRTGLIGLEAVYIRDYSADPKHHKTDDYIYGGGAGLLMQAQPIYDCYRHIVDTIDERRGITASSYQEEEQTGGEEDIAPRPDKRYRTIYLTPQGRTFDQRMAEDLAREEELILLCGHYEGVDERVLEEIVTDYVSIGDYVLTGGELAACVVIDAVTRLLPGVLHNDESASDESFSSYLLEYPQYSRPEVWRGKRVPEILLSGHHAKVDEWRRQQAIERTKERRPDLYRKYLEETGAADPEERV